MPFPKTALLAAALAVIPSAYAYWIFGGTPPIVTTRLGNAWLLLIVVRRVFLGRRAVEVASNTCILRLLSLSAISLGTTSTKEST